ncbi:MAG: hypothetical protein BAJATHORv1_10564 [Candidatus Thorarchaeota archaeon]|nr:MAG: hypothetical protein BAJATHORv1_10564 [Candidatus Thorarchaeota archaeon]
MSRILRRQFKVCLLGNGFVGKTSIRREYLKEGFKRSYIPTLGVDFAQKQTEYKDIPTTLVIWDIAGQEAYKRLRRQYYQGCSGMVLVYSVVDRQSFDDATKWLVEAHGFIEKFPPLIIAANKIDLRPTHLIEETVTTKEGLEFTERFRERLGTPVIFLETSALENINIDEAFEALTKMMVGDEAFEEIELEYSTRPKASTSEVEPKVSELQESLREEPSTAEADTQQAETVDRTESIVADRTADSEVKVETNEEPTGKVAVSSSEATETSSRESVTERFTPSSEQEESTAKVFKSGVEVQKESVDEDIEEVEKPAREIVEIPYTEDGDLEPITSLPAGSQYLKEEEIGKAMAKLVELRKKLKEKEDELANILSEAEKKLLTLKNTVHVKKLMYDHLQEQLEQTRKEWADAYDEYVEVDTAKKKAVSKKLEQMKDIRDHIEEVGRGIRKRVSKLDLKNMAE